MLEVREIHHIDEWPQLGEVWNRLCDQTPNATFFHTFDWFNVYWRHFGDKQSLRLILVSAENSPLGILPLVLQAVPTRLGEIRTLTYPLETWGSFYSPLGPQPAVTLEVGLRHVLSGRADWDVLDLQWVDADGTDGGRTQGAFESIGASYESQVTQQVSVIDLQGTYEDYLAARGGKFRRNLNKSYRDVARRGRMTIDFFRPRGETHGESDPRWDLYDQCVDIAKRSWQGSSTNGNTLSTGQVAAFLRDVHEIAARMGAVEICLLRMDGQPVAFQYHYHYHGNQYFFRRGFDATTSRDGLGSVLLAESIRRCYDLGDRSIDMFSGSIEAKRHWRTALLSSYSFRHYALSSVRAQLLRGARWLKQRMGINSDETDRLADTPPPRVAHEPAEVH